MEGLISTAMAQGTTAAPAASSGMSTMIFMLGIAAIMYFMMIRPQQKRAKEQQAMLAALGAGDEVVTSGGMLARIVEVGDNYLTLEISDGVRVKVQKNSVTQVLPKGSIKNA
jgi:preprotein translocase subunit YajC